VELKGKKALFENILVFSEEISKAIICKGPLKQESFVEIFKFFSLHSKGIANYIFDCGFT